MRPPLYLTTLAALLLTCCVATRPVHYYTLAPASVPTSQAKPDGPIILVGVIATPESLQDDRIRYRAGANETGAYEYHRWTERPGAMVRDSLVRALRASGKYQRVLEASSSAMGDYLVRGKLYEFTEVDNPAIQTPIETPIETKISLQLELIDEKTNRTVWDRHSERAEPASGKTIKDVVESMDRNLQRVAIEAAAEIGRFLSSGGAPPVLSSEQGVPMGFRKALYGAGLGVASLAALYAFQRPFHQFPGVEYENFEVPADWNQPGEWAFARLMYPPGPNDGYAGRFDGDWREGLSLWTQDYPRADRHFSQALRRLTRIHVRSVEQPVNLDEGDAYDWPWLYAVQVGEWGLTDAQAKKLREYLLRGGFFMADDFHGNFEWEMFEQRIKRVFPDRPIVEIEDQDAIFHTVYDLDDRYQVPGAAHLRLGYKNNGVGAHWRGIYDDQGRIMVAISYNSDLGDAWEWADEPRYPEKFSALAIRIGVNYVVYAMTH